MTPRPPATRTRRVIQAIHQIAWLVVSASLLACPEYQPEALPTEVRIALHGNPLSLDPHTKNEALTFSVLSHLYEPLVRIDGRGKLVPALASRWLNPDERRWHFVVREGVRFHDGRQLDASDVVASLERARRHPQSDMASYLVEIAEVRALDARTVEIVTSKPYPILLNKLAFILILPRDADASREEETAIGTGPYRLEGRIPGQEVRLVANADHWSGRPAIEKVRFLAMPAAAARVAALRAGEVDLVQELPSSAAAELRSAGLPHCCEVRHLPSLQVEFLGFRQDRKPFDDPRVRRAIDLALDRRLLVERSLHGYGEPTRQLVGINIFGFDPSLSEVERDLAGARRLLTEAGYPDGIEIEIAARVGRPIEELVRQLGEAGIRVKPRIEPWPELYRRLQARQVDCYFGGMLAVSADASDIFDSLVHSTVPGQGYGLNNHMDYRNPELDALIERSGTTLDMMQRRDILQAAMRRTLEDGVYLGLFNGHKLYAHRKDLVWQPRIDGFIWAQEMRFARKGEVPTNSATTR